LQDSKPLAAGNWSSSLVWGRKATKRDLNSYLIESVLPIHRSNFVTGRIELVDKDELFHVEPEIAANSFRVGALTRLASRAISLGFEISKLASAQISAVIRFRVRSSRITANIRWAAMCFYVFGLRLAEK